MIICDKCRKVIWGKKGKYYRVSFDIKPNRDDGTMSIYENHFHTYCYSKVFIFRPDGFLRNCVCGDFASYSHRGKYVSVRLLTDSYSEYTNYYHLEHFRKYYMLDVLDDMLKI